MRQDIEAGNEFDVTPKYVLNGVEYANYNNNVLVQITSSTETSTGRQIAGIVRDVVLDDGNGNTLTATIEFDASFYREDI